MLDLQSLEFTSLPSMNSARYGPGAGLLTDCVYVFGAYGYPNAPARSTT